MANNFATLLRQDCRFRLLLILSRAPQYRANHCILREALTTFGHDMSLDAVIGELAWLEDQQLVTLEHLDTITVPTLTGRGLDVAQGRVSVPGIKRPLPGDV